MSLVEKLMIANLVFSIITFLSIIGIQLVFFIIANKIDDEDASEISQSYEYIPYDEYHNYE